MMHTYRIATLLVAVTLFGGEVAAQTPEQIKAEPIVKLKPGDTTVPGQCLSKEQLDLIAALNALRRPTVGLEENGDDPAPFDPHYFVGSWLIKGLLADSPLGAGGEFSGTESVRQVGACAFESTLQGKTADGDFTIKTMMVYDRPQNYLVRLEDYNQGHRLLKVGPVGGDPGGFYNHIWETPPIVVGPTTVRLKGRTMMWSPVAFRTRIEVSENGGPFTNIGTLSWERTTPSKP
jgi:hypothetical protein